MTRSRLPNNGQAHRAWSGALASASLVFALAAAFLGLLLA
jgi:hypothetical protein